MCLLFGKDVVDSPVLWCVNFEVVLESWFAFLFQLCSKFAGFAVHGGPLRLFIKSCADRRFEGGIVLPF